MKTRSLGAALVLLALPLLGAAGTVSVRFPPDSVPYKPGPNLQLVQVNCLTCHSAAYVYTQPRLTRAQWTAEVTKMKAAYGAPIDAGNIPAIVDYLMSQNGKE